MSYNGSGTFQINTTGQPVVAGTIISSAAFNALTADLATGLTTAITKDGQTTTTARIPFAQGITSTLVTDASSTTTGSIITAGGAGIAKKLYVGTDASIGGTLAVTGVSTYSNLTASSAVATDASKNLVSVTNTGTGSNVLATNPTIASVNLTTALTLAGAAGDSGQVLTSAGSGLPTWVTPTGGFILGTPVATTSGTSIDFTGIPAGVKQIVISFKGVSTNSSSQKLIQIGDSGGIEFSGYFASSVVLTSIVSLSTSSVGFNIDQTFAADSMYGNFTLTLENSSTFSWTAVGNVSANTGSSMAIMSGAKSLSATLDRVRITTVTGTDTFDAGEINIAYI